MAENSVLLYSREQTWGAQLRRHVFPEDTCNNLGMI